LLPNTYPNASGDVAILQDYAYLSPTYAQTAGEFQITTNHAITIGALELDVDDNSMYYDFTVDQPSSQYFAFDNTVNDANATINMGAVNGAIGIGLDRFDAPVRLVSNLEIKGKNLRFAGGLSGSGGIFSYLTGTLFLDGSVNDISTGGMLVDGGTVQIDNDAELGDGNVELEYGTLNSIRTTSGNRHILVEGLSSMSAAANATLAETGVIAGEGSLTLSGAGTVELGTDNSYSGGTILSGGSPNQAELLVAADSSLGNTKTNAPITYFQTGLNTPLLMAAAGFTTNRQILLDTNGAVGAYVGTTLTLDGQITGPGKLYVEGAGTVVIGNSTNSYSGGTEVDSGTLMLARGATAGTGKIVNNGGTLGFEGDRSFAQDLSGDSAAFLAVSFGSTVTASGQISTVDLIAEGGGTLVLTNIFNSYTGYTGLQAGVVKFSDDRELGDPTAYVNFIGGTLEDTSTTSTARPFTGTGSNNINVNVDSGQTLTNSGVISGSGALVADGLGTLYITNPNNTYSGGTYLDSGVVYVQYDSNLGAASTPIYFSGGTLETSSDIFSSRPVILNQNGTFQIDAGFWQANNTITGPGELFVTGGSELILNTGGNTWSGGTNIGPGATLYAAQVGSLPSGGAITNNGTLIAAGNGTHVVGAINGIGFLQVGLFSPTTLQIAPGSGATSIGSLTLNANSTLDLTNNHLFIDYGSGADPIAAIRSYLITGYAAGAWSGPGIDSSTAAANSHYALGYADGADNVVAGLSSGVIEIKYTLLGDADLNGSITGSDFTILAGNFGKSDKGWDQGDFDYNGVVNGSDFTALVGNLGKSATGAAIDLPAADWVALDAFAASRGMLADVPEPLAPAIFISAALLQLTRRQQRAERPAQQQ
jgi:autotransporter-associated beta strand protein